MYRFVLCWVVFILMSFGRVQAQDENRGDQAFLFSSAVDVSENLIRVRVDDDLLSTLGIGDVVQIDERGEMLRTGGELGDIAQRELILNGFVDWSDERSVGGILNSELGEEAGSFHIAVRDQVIAGYVRIAGVGVYQFSGFRGEEMVAELTREDEFVACAGGIVPADQGGEQIGQAEQSEPREQINDAEPIVGEFAGDDDVAMIDVMVAYTAEAKNARGGAAQMLAFIDLAIAASNRAYVNSHIGSELRLVHTYEVDYNENTSDYGTHLRRLTNNDGFIDEIHDLRDEYGADMVSMMVNDQRSCGNAWTMRSISPFFEDDAFSVVTWNCAVGNMSFAHELGHNMGACHAPGDPCSGGVHSYSQGHRFTGQNGASWRTVMAYSPGSRIEYFSNPSVIFDGRFTGVSLVSDNARTLDLSGPTVADFRDEAPDCRVDLTGEGNVDFFDISVFIAFFNGQAPEADFTGDGVWNFFDVSAFMIEFAAGCP